VRLVQQEHNLIFVQVFFPFFFSSSLFLSSSLIMLFLWSTRYGSLVKTACRSSWANPHYTTTVVSSTVSSSFAFGPRKSSSPPWLTTRLALSTTAHNSFPHHDPLDTHALPPAVEPKVELVKTPVERHYPRPIRSEFAGRKPLSSKDLEELDCSLYSHRKPVTWSDFVALGIVKALRVPADAFFSKRYLNRAVVLETVAAVPGMVAAMIRHLRSLRRMKHDGGWISHLLNEAENERMHLMTWMRVCQPNILERSLVGATQAAFFSCFALLYALTPRTAHRVVGYLEEEAVISYTLFLQEIDIGRIQNVDAPDIAKWYWNLQPNAKLRDVVLAVRYDEALHRDVNHHFSDRIFNGKQDLLVPLRQSECGLTVTVPPPTPPPTTVK
jgi:ubiquinol oxidase